MLPLGESSVGVGGVTVISGGNLVAVEGMSSLGMLGGIRERIRLESPCFDGSVLSADRKTTFVMSFYSQTHLSFQIQLKNGVNISTCLKQLALKCSLFADRMNITNSAALVYYCIVQNTKWKLLVLKWNGFLSIIFCYSLHFLE